MKSFWLRKASMQTCITASTHSAKEIAEEYLWYIKCIINIAKVLVIADKYDILSVGSYKAERAML